MKKFMFLNAMLMVVFFCSCGKSQQELNNEQNELNRIDGFYCYDIVTIDSCEYIVTRSNGYNGRAICHKENCKYCEAKKHCH